VTDFVARWSKLQTVTRGLCFFFVFDALCLNALLALLPVTPQHKTVLNYTVGALAGHAKDDSWGQMTTALEEFRLHPDRPLYADVFFHRHIRFPYPPTSLFVTRQCGRREWPSARGVTSRRAEWLRAFREDYPSTRTLPNLGPAPRLRRLRDDGVLLVFADQTLRHEVSRRVRGSGNVLTMIPPAATRSWTGAGRELVDGAPVRIDECTGGRIRTTIYRVANCVAVGVGLAGQ